MSMVAYQCCICGANIDEAAHKLDPCYIQINTNITGDEEQQLEQGFFCHYECYKNMMDYDGHLNLEDQEAHVAREYLKSGKPEEAIVLYEKLITEAVEPTAIQSLLPEMIQCYKALNDEAQQKKYLERGLELCNQGHESAGIYYEAAAMEYASDDIHKAGDYIEKFKLTYETNSLEESEERTGYEIKEYGARIAIHIALGEVEPARSMCREWIDAMGPYQPTTREEAGAINPIAACIDYLKDADLLFRLAESTFLRSSAPSLAFAYKGLAERMLGNDEKACGEFLKYKQFFREQVEDRGDDFEEVWEELRQYRPGITNFEIPDPDPDTPLSILVDDSIQRYGKSTDIG